MLIGIQIIINDPVWKIHDQSSLGFKFFNWSRKAGLDPNDSLIFYLSLGIYGGGDMGLIYSFGSGF